MNEREAIKYDKPPEILELETMFQNLIEFEIFEPKNESQKIARNYYSTNNENEIIALSLNDIGISNIDFLLNFSKLELLGLTYNNINDISCLSSLKNLKYLYLGGNNIKTIEPIACNLELIELAIWGNQIQDLNLLKNLTRLKCLFAQRNELLDIGFIQNLTILETVDLSSNNLENIYPISDCRQITKLNIDNNRISDISNLTDLKKISFLSTTKNQIRTINRGLAEQFNWQINSITQESNKYAGGFFTNLNPLEFPPASVIELGPETTKNYYEAAEEFGHAPLSEGRIIFIGDGSSGKSSIIEKVLYNSFTLGRQQTNGIKIEHLHLPHPDDKRDLTFHLWDFGGQEIQHAVHKFFFTEGCLYVLVLDNRKEEEPEYWLQQIESLGGSAPVLVVFNKQDESAAETADRKYLKEKYPNIIRFFNTSCKTGFGIDDFKKTLYDEVVKLRTVNEQFPNNWLEIKKAIEQHTSGSQHYLTYETYREICRQNHTENEETQKLLLRYFNKIGVVTWFGGDAYLQFLHVLKPEWITQGVYKILTAKKTANLFGQIHISDFKELLQPLSNDDYSYNENHYGYILSMMKKFDLCYSPDDKSILIPSAFGKMPKVEYSDYKGEAVRTYILQFAAYMPLALIHRYTAKNLPYALDNNYWYSGIVIKDSKSDSVAMVHADKEAKRIYVRIKGESKSGLWEHIRREMEEITSSYAKIPYDELVAVDQADQSTVSYDDLVNHIKAGKQLFFHSKLRKDFNVGYLMGFFETKDETIDKVKTGTIALSENRFEKLETVPPFVINILNNNSPQVNTNINTQITIDIDIQVVNELGSSVKGDANYLLEALGDSNKALSDALQKVVEFADDAKAARHSGDVKEKGWGRKLKNALEVLGKTGEQFKNIKDGGEAFHSMLHHLHQLASQLNLEAIAKWFS